MAVCSDAAAVSECAAGWLAGGSATGAAALAAALALLLVALAGRILVADGCTCFACMKEWRSMAARGRRGEGTCNAC